MKNVQIQVSRLRKALEPGFAVRMRRVAHGACVRRPAVTSSAVRRNKLDIDRFGASSTRTEALAAGSAIRLTRCSRQRWPFGADSPLSDFASTRSLRARIGRLDKVGRGT